MSSNFCLDRVLTIIPVLNEEETISDVIRSLQYNGLTKICVVDNGSTDRSIAQARVAGAEVLVEPVAGYGRACWRGLQDLPPDIEWILFADGDGSDDLSQLPEFFAAAAQRDREDRPVDFILGDRRATAAGRAAMTPVQNFGNGLATFLIGIGWGYWYRDLGPLRMIRRNALERIQMQDRGFGWTVEMQARAVECGLNIREITVGYRRRQGGRSKISGTLSGSFKAGTVILRTLGKLYLTRLQHSKSKTQNSNLTSPSHSLLLWMSALLLLLGCAWIVPHGDFRVVGAVPHFWMGIAVMSLGFVLSWMVRRIEGMWFWAIAVLTRSLLLPMYPGDDIWRYIWEGHIQNLGFSPYHLPPNAPELLPFRTEWWSQINHIETSAIYPPIAQLGFRALAAISISVLLFKLAFIFADLGVCWLLARNYGYPRALLYAWNPLIIYSFAGGAHYDSWFILPLVAAWIGFEQRRWSWSALALGISVAIKWMSLPILGFLAWLKLPRFKSGVAIAFLGVLPLFFSVFPFCNVTECLLIPTGSTFVSRGRSAELIPFLVGWIWPRSTQYNWIYSIPIACVLMGLLWREHWRWRERSLALSSSFLDFCELYFFAVLILSPIVHAWYFSWIVPFAVVSRNLGTRLVSLSAFVYFALPHRQAIGDRNWYLTLLERTLMWLPFVVGFLFSKNRSLLSRRWFVPRKSLPEKD